MRDQKKYNDDFRRNRENMEIVESKKLTDEQYQYLFDAHNKDKFFEERIQTIIAALVDESYERGRSFWNAVALVFGYDDYEKVKDGIQLSVNWLDRTAEKKKRKD